MFDVDIFGEPVSQRQGSRLAESFEYPPFSVLNAREGWWQERKRQWLSLGIKSELGRGGDLIPNGGGNGSKARYDQGVINGKPAAAASDCRHGLHTWQNDKRAEGCA